jgi:hypothetical protein
MTGTPNERISFDKKSPADFLPGCMEKACFIV